MKNTKVKDLIVKKSKIHGKGVFANRTFQNGETVLKWDLSHKVKKQDIPELPAAIRKNVYFYKGRYIVPSSPGRYLNHSCNPNTIAKDGHDLAKRIIKKGEEITINFLDENILHPSFDCHCGSGNCISLIQNQRKQP